MNRDKFLIFGSPRIEEDEIEAVKQVMTSAWLGTGPKVAEFEASFAKYKGSTYATAVSSCTAALHLSALACGLEHGTEALVPALTFCATANAMIHAGAIPVAVDVEEASMNIDPAAASDKASPRTKAIVPVHFAGRPCRMDELTALAKKKGLKIIEDCAHAIETIYHGKPAGTLGDYGCFSFYVTKNIVTGEGGMVISNDGANNGRIRVLALHGMTKDAWKRFSDSGYKHYQVVEAGFKYNMMDLQAVIGLHQLQKIERYWVRRQEVWGRYQEAFAGTPLILPSEPEPDTRHAYHLYTIRVDKKRTGVDRDRFLDEMTARKIGVGVHYLSLTEHPYYQDKYGWKPEDTPIATMIGRQTVSLPISAKLTDDDVGDVIKAVKYVLGCR